MSFIKSFPMESFTAGEEWIIANKIVKCNAVIKNIKEDLVKLRKKFQHDVEMNIVLATS